MNPFDVVRQFEAALCEYTGAPFAVATTSCTTALMIAMARFDPTIVTIPNRTYIGVAQAVLNAGHELSFRLMNWEGQYRLHPLPVIDSARLLTSGMYEPGTFTCLSFHWAKHLAIGQGGAILHDDAEADAVLRRMRFDGRTEGVSPAKDVFTTPAWHAYMMPRDAAEGLSRLALLPKHNDPLPWSDYADLSKCEAFK